MALELVGGAALGAAVKMLLKEVIDAKEKAANFQQALTRLESTLRSIVPRVNEISQLNHKLKVPDEEMKELITILRNGQALVNKSSKISSINLVRKAQYSTELLELDYSLFRYFQTILPLDHVRDTKEMLLMMRELHRGHFGAKDGCSEILSSQQPDEGKSSKPKVDEYSEIKSSQEPDEGESSRPKVDEYSEIKSSQEPDEGESSRPKVDEYSEIKSSQEPDEGESSKPKGDEYSEIQSCQDPEKKETVKLFGKVLLMMRGLHMGLVGAKDEEESSKPKEDESSQEPDEGESSNPKGDEYSKIQSCQDPEKKETVIPAKKKKKTLELVIKIEDEIISSRTLFTGWRWTWTFRLKGCTYIFDPEEYSINSDEMGTNYVANCQCKKGHGYVMVSRIEKVRIGKREFEQHMETSVKLGNQPNIVTPFGYCFYRSELFLFYDSLPGCISLYRRLHGTVGSLQIKSPVETVEWPGVRRAYDRLSWQSQLKISLGVARGISHLHSVKRIHGNLNSSNVLVNNVGERYDPDGRIYYDYGLLEFSSAAKKSDVYSFGVLLLEIVSETKPPSESVRTHDSGSAEKGLHRWIAKAVHGNIIVGEYNNWQRKMLKIAMLCVVKDLDGRPEMDDVVKMIQKIWTPPKRIAHSYFS